MRILVAAIGIGGAVWFASAFAPPRGAGPPRALGGAVAPAAPPAEEHRPARGSAPAPGIALPRDAGPAEGRPALGAPRAAVDPVAAADAIIASVEDGAICRGDDSRAETAIRALSRLWREPGLRAVGRDRLWTVADDAARRIVVASLARSCADVEIPEADRIALCADLADLLTASDDAVLAREIREALAAIADDPILRALDGVEAGALDPDEEEDRSRTARENGERSDP